MLLDAIKSMRLCRGRETSQVVRNSNSKDKKAQKRRFSAHAQNLRVQVRSKIDRRPSAAKGGPRAADNLVPVQTFWENLMQNYKKNRASVFLVICCAFVNRNISLEIYKKCEDSLLRV